MTGELLPFPLLTVPRAPSPSLEAWRVKYADLAIELEAEVRELLSFHPDDDKGMAKALVEIDGLVRRLRDHVQRGAE